MAENRERRERVLPVANCDKPNRCADVVFVHGLNSNNVDAWTHHETGLFWPQALGRDMPDVGIWSFGYEASPTEWFGGHALPLQDRATEALEQLSVRGIGERPVFFIVHSMGGLVVKWMLRHAADFGTPDWKNLLNQTKGIVFFGTPHAGADVANWVKILGGILRESVAVDDLRHNHPGLRDLNLWYRNNARQRNISTLVYFEEKNTLGVRVVDETSADPGLEGVIPIPVDTDHVGVCRIDGPEDVRYLRVVRFIQQGLASVASPKPDQPIEDDSKIVTFLERLTPSDFGRILVRLPGSQNQVPENTSHLQRVQAFMRYVHASGGPGIVRLREVLTTIFPGNAPNFDLPPTTNGTMVRGLRAVPKGATHFTGREDVLTQLHENLRADGQVGLSQAISGLGGIGKTSVAVRYTELYGSEYPGICWFDASSTATLDTDYGWLAKEANLPQKDATDSAVVREAVRQYLESDQIRRDGKPVLLIFDNLDSIEEVAGMLPRAKSACILFTSRLHNLRSVGIQQPILLDVLPMSEALQFLASATGRTFTGQDELTAAQELVTELGGLPLALEQAANYIADPDTEVNFQTYLAAYRNRKLELLEQAKISGGHYKESVGTTYDILFQRIAGEPVAYLLWCCAFLAPDRIPIEIFRNNAEVFPPPLKEALEKAKEDEMSWRELLKPATRYGLLLYTDEKASEEADRTTLHIHRMVQEAIRDDFHVLGMVTGNARFALNDIGNAVAASTYRAIAQTFPGTDFRFWPLLERLLPHQITCTNHVFGYGWCDANIAAVFHHLSVYTYTHGNYRDAETYINQAIRIKRLALPENHPAIGDSLTLCVTNSFLC